MYVFFFYFFFFWSHDLSENHSSYSVLQTVHSNSPHWSKMEACCFVWFQISAIYSIMFVLSNKTRKWVNVY